VRGAPGSSQAGRVSRPVPAATPIFPPLRANAALAVARRLPLPSSSSPLPSVASRQLFGRLGSAPARPA
jgi:hypothetical protein